MFRPDATPIELCKWFVPHLARSMSLAGCDELDETYTCGPFTITFKGRDDDKDGDPHLPRQVRRAADKAQDVYRAFAAIWNEPGRPQSPVMPKDIIKWLRAEYARAEPDTKSRKDAPRSSVHHALTDLQDLGVLHQHGDGGWVLGPRGDPGQGTMFVEEGVPVENGTPEHIAQTVTSEHPSPTRGDKGSPPAQGAQEMFGGKQIWVPGEKDEFQTGGLIITDAGGTCHLAEGAQARVRYSGRSGRPVAPFAVRCELVTVEDDGRYQLATVKIKGPEGRKQVRVRVLGDWQLDGRMSDRDEPAEVAN